MVSIKEFINDGWKCDVIFKGNGSVELTVATDGTYSFDRYLRHVDVTTTARHYAAMKEKHMKQAGKIEPFAE